jgi:hypothetical protein
MTCFEPMGNQEMTSSECTKENFVQMEETSYSYLDARITPGTLDGMEEESQTLTKEESEEGGFVEDRKAAAKPKAWTMQRPQCPVLMVLRSETGKHKFNLPNL